MAAIGKNMTANQGPGFLPEVVVKVAKRLSASERDITAGRSKVTVPLGSVVTRERDAMGRHGHLIGFEIDATIQVDVVAASLSAAYDGERLLELFDNIELTAGGVPFFAPNIDGRRLRLDTLLRTGSLAVEDPEDIVDSDATNDEISVRCRYLFGNPLNGKFLRNGAIPLYMLNSVLSGQDVLKFDLETDINNEAGVSGITFDGYNEVVVYGIYLYSGRPILNPGWHLAERVTSNNQETIFAVHGQRDTRLEYAAVHYLDEDGGDASLTTEFSGKWTVQHGDSPWLAGVDTDELVRAGRITSELSAYLGHRGGFQYQGVTANGVEGIPRSHVVPLAQSRPNAKWSELGRAPLHFEHSTDPANVSNYRILNRQIFAMSDAWVDEYLRRAGFPGGRADVMSRPTANLDISKGLLPREVVRRPSS